MERTPPFIDIGRNKTKQKSAKNQAKAAQKKQSKQINKEVESSNDHKEATSTNKEKQKVRTSARLLNCLEPIKRQKHRYASEFQHAASQTF